jgi:hypothetical protein
MDGREDHEGEKHQHVLLRRVDGRSSVVFTHVVAIFVVGGVVDRTGPELIFVQ